MSAFSRPSRAGYPLVAYLAAAIFISYIDRTNMSVGALAMQAEFGWSETHKGAVLCAFYIGYLPVMIALGAVSNRFGGRAVLGCAVIWWSAFTALTPFAAFICLPALLIARSAIGLGEAAVFPASFTLIGRHIPAEYRSRAVTLVTSSTALGTVFALFVSGWLIRFYGWPMPFYAFAVIGWVWAVLWFCFPPALVQTAPPQKPGRAAIPWSALMRTPSVWAIVAGHFCYNWCAYLLIAWMPSYFKNAFGVSVAWAGILSAAPWLVVYVTANLAGHLADHLVSRGVAVVTVRRMAQVTGLAGAALFLVLLPLCTSVSTAVVLMCMSTGILGLCQAGFAANCLDIAPRHADVLYGISNTVATLPGLFGVFITGWLVDETGSFAAAFLVSAAIAVCGAIIYWRLASGKPEILADDA